MYGDLVPKAKKLVGKYNIGHSPRDLKHGVSFFFFKFSKDLGFKFARPRRGKSSLKNRDLNYKRQKLAARHGLAPPVYRKLSFKLAGETYYGFITGVASRVGQGNYSPELGRKLENIGINHLDLHAFNIGMYKGKLVCIDFDRRSVPGRA